MPRVACGNKLLIGLALCLAVGVSHLPAIDRWAALSQVESGDNDRVIGAAGEISRYQIRPKVWRAYAPAQADWQNAADALEVAKAIMRKRCARFEASFQRPPTDREFYILWNAPAKIKRPDGAVLRRAERFFNLVRTGQAKPADGVATTGQ